jgi:hypothetical protein
MLLAGPARAAVDTWYAAPTAQGTGDGLTAANAMAIATAITTADGGDTVLLRSGTYPVFASSSSGTYNRNNTDWIIWREDAGQTVVFGEGMRFGGIGSVAKWYCRFENVEVRTNATTAPIRNMGVWTYGGTSTSTTTAGYLAFVDCTFTNTTTGSMCIQWSNCTELLVDGCTLTHSSSTPSDWRNKAIMLQQISTVADLTTNVTIRDCTISRQRYGLDLTGTNVLISGCEIFDCTSDGILVQRGFVNSEISDCNIHHIYNCVDDVYPTDHEDCIQFMAGDSNPEGTTHLPWNNIRILRNLLHDVGRQGFHSGDITFAPATNVTIANNIVWNTASWSFDWQEMGSGLKFNHNTCIGDNIGVEATAAGYEICNNIIEFGVDFKTGNGAGTAIGNVCQDNSDLDNDTNMNVVAFEAMFTAYDTNDFTLAAGSAALDVCAIVDPNKDKDGKERKDIAGTGNDGTNYADAGALENLPPSNPFPGLAVAPGPATGATGVALAATLAWTAGADTDDFDLYFGVDSTPDVTEFIDNREDATYDPGGLLANTTYYWRIDPNNENGKVEGTIWSFTTTAGGAPAKAVYPAPADEAVGVTRSLRLSWAHGAAETPGFKLYCGTSEGGMVLLATQDDLTYALPMLAPATTYYWRVDTVEGEDTTTGDVWTFTTRTAGQKVRFRK